MLSCLIVLVFHVLLHWYESRRKLGLCTYFNQYYGMFVKRIESMQQWWGIAIKKKKKHLLLAEVALIVGVMYRSRIVTLV